ncbi:MAG TPA: hypothetical protein VHO48_06565, partial [Anaerolineaceae bacterium]|nr:hypothetical protein [Anaerolineaceae bacterium]
MRYTAQNLNELAWPGSRLEEAVEWLARTSGLVPVGVSIHDQPVAAAFASGQAGWQQSVESAAALLGIEAEPVSCTYATLEDFFRGAAPAIIQLPSGAPSDAHGTDPADAAQPVPSSQFIVIKKSGRNCHILSSALK